MRRYIHAILGSLVVFALLAFSHPAAPAGSTRLSVRVINRSQPTLCAEKDNVSLMFQARELRRFRIEAAHPTYINMLSNDSWEADWTSCDMHRDPAVVAEPRSVRLYEGEGVTLVGYTNPSFWRKNSVPVRVGERTETGLHLVQLWITSGGKSHEVLAFYPPDGYWRARPLPPPQLGASVYGSSFLVGPVEQEAGRPVVNLREIDFDPAQRTFTLRYANGSVARMKLASSDSNRLVLDVEFERATTDQLPFAALRSMYVTEYNADVARIALKDPNAKRWREAGIMGFQSGLANHIWTGRLVPSRHNTSAPDMVFYAFER